MWMQHVRGKDILEIKYRRMEQRITNEHVGHDLIIFSEMFSDLM